VCGPKEHFFEQPAARNHYRIHPQSACAITPRHNIDDITRRVPHLSSRRMLWALGLIIWECGSQEIRRIILSFWPFEFRVLIRPIAASSSPSMRIRTCLLLLRSSPSHSFLARTKKTDTVSPHLPSHLACPTTVLAKVDG